MYCSKCDGCLTYGTNCCLYGSHAIANMFDYFAYRAMHHSNIPLTRNFVLSIQLSFKHCTTRFSATCVPHILASLSDTGDADCNDQHVQSRS